ncbi:hypothetical protein LEC33_28605, partial [Salmonella enterica]|nr:hypothetical protein [Salmonella enterica]MDJ7339421.1 hypothetical protein [Salmonella enterica]
VAEGAFDDFIRHLEYEKELWKDLKENCKANNEYPVRIGNIIPAEAPEQRLFGKVIEAYSLKTDSDN